MSPKAQRARIVVGPRRPPELIVPEGTSLEEADAFLTEKRAWIEEKVSRSRAIASRPARLGLDRPNTVWMHGRPLKVQVKIQDGQRTASASLQEPDILVIRGAAGSPETQLAIERWYRREARARFSASVTREAEQIGLPLPGSVAIRDAKTRWGSCSTKGNVSFSWRLLIAPEPVADYVVIHELCHLLEPSHSKAFWRRLEAAMPGWQENDRWLKEHGRELREWAPRLVELATN